MGGAHITADVRDSIVSHKQYIKYGQCTKRWHISEHLLTVTTTLKTLTTTLNNGTAAVAYKCMIWKEIDGSTCKSLTSPRSERHLTNGGETIMGGGVWIIILRPATCNISSLCTRHLVFFSGVHSHGEKHVSRIQAYYTYMVLRVV